MKTPTGLKIDNPAWPLLLALISYWGTTDNDGNAAGTTIRCGGLATEPPYDNHALKILGGPSAGQTRDLTTHPAGTDTLTVIAAFTNVAGVPQQITAGTRFVILSKTPAIAEVAALTTMVETNQYYDRVFYDLVNGIAGTGWPVGTPQVPSNVIADVITMCTTRNLRNIDVHGALQLLATMEHYCFFGHCHESIADVVDLNGQDVDNSRFDNCVITGAQGGTLLATYIDCILYNMTGFRGMAERCALYTPLAVSVGVSDFDHCTSLHQVLTVTVGTPTRLSFKEFSGGMILTAQTAGAVLVRGISGYLEVDAMNGAGATLDIYAHGTDIQINANCLAGTINIYGDARVTVIAGATVTVNNHTIQVEGGALGLTTFGQETAAGVAADGVNDVTLFDGTGITKPTKICGFMCTMAGAAWAGHPVVWIEDGDGNKIFPFQDNYVEGTDFADGAQVVFNFPVVVPVASGYRVRFRSTAAGDNAGQTLDLDNLDIIEVG